MNNSSFEREISEKGTIIYTNVGDSMMPLIKEGRDVLVISKPNSKRLKKGDIALYKRDSGQYVLHRVIKVREGDYIFCGDNRTKEEEGITDFHIIGILTDIITDGKQKSLYSSSMRINTARVLIKHYFKVRFRRIKKKIKNG